MEEVQVGISEYTTATTGFSGTLKHRYEDFQVFEVDLTGITAHLTSLNPPQPDDPVPNAQLTEASIAEIVEAFKDKAGPANAERLAALLTSIHHLQHKQRQPAEGPSPSPAPAAAAAAEGGCGGGGSSSGNAQEQEPEVPVAYLLPIKDKDVRKAVHTFLKTDPRLPPLETDTVSASSGPEAAAAAVALAAQQQDPESEGTQGQPAGASSAEVAQQQQKDAEALNIIRVLYAADVPGLKRKRGAAAHNQQHKAHRKDRKQRNWQTSQWLGGDNKYTRFVLLKENMDTQAALGVVGRMLHLHSHAFGFAGTKDRRGITTQYITLFKVEPQRLAALNPRLRGIKLGNYDFCSSPLQLGSLRGNAFRILMRDVDTHDENHIASAVTELRERGFINYFGLQRFGTGNVPTHRVGAALLRGEWQAAVELILQGAPHEKEDVKAARDKYTKEGDVKGALDGMPTWMVAERAILQTLLKQGASSYTSALQAVPRTLRSMYMHAWQSYCWNTAASERIRRHGADKVVAGDLVLPPAAAAAAGGGAAAAEAAAALSEADGGSGVAAGGVEGTGAAAAAGMDDEVEASSAAARLAAVHVVTAEEAEQGTYSITDVVLPLPGGQVQYPQHAAGWELYCRLAAADGIMLPGMTDAEYTAAAAAASAAAAAAAKETAAAGVGSDTDNPAAAGAAGAAPAAAAEGAAAAKPRQHSVREFQLAGLSGDYRRLLHRPASMTHKVVRYTHVNQPDLLPTDLIELQQTGQQQQQQQKRLKPSDATQQLEQQSKRQKLDAQQQLLEGQVQGENGGQQVNGQGQKAGEKFSQEGAAATPEQLGEGEGVKTDAMETDADAHQRSSDRSTSGVSTAAAAASSGVPSGADGAQGGVGSSGGGEQQQQRIGVILEFSLPSSCYATMLIRELTKTSTSKAAHKQLSAKQ